MRPRLLLLLSSLLVAALAVPAHAYTLPSADEDGWVGKGEVQEAFGWNDHAMQDNYGDITFRYVTAGGGYTFACEWWTGKDGKAKRHETTAVKESGAGAVVELAATPRLNPQGHMTGYWLDATALAAAATADYPTDADCGAEGNGMKSIVPGSVEALGGEESGLYAVYGGEAKLLPVLP